MKRLFFSVVAIFAFCSPALAAWPNGGYGHQTGHRYYAPPPP